eukprot:793682-Pleurochrysis_carterae.AAC.1
MSTARERGEHGFCILWLSGVSIQEACGREVWTQRREFESLRILGATAIRLNRCLFGEHAMRKTPGHSSGRRLAFAFLRAARSAAEFATCTLRCVVSGARVLS